MVRIYRNKRQKSVNLGKVGILVTLGVIVNSGAYGNVDSETGRFRDTTHGCDSGSNVDSVVQIS